MGRSKRLQINLPAAATPARVAAAARMMAEALDAAYPGLPPDSVTMVVDNFEMRAEVRAWGPEGEAAVADVVAFLENPTRAIHKKPSAARIGDAVAKYAEPLECATIKRPRARKQIAILDPRFARELRALAAAREPPRTMHGTTQIHSVIYRVGRTDDDADVRARVRLENDEIHDVRIASHADVASFYDAAKNGGVCAIGVEAAWFSVGETLVLDYTRSRLTSALPLQATSGAEFIQTARAQIQGAFDDVEDIIAGIEDR